ncbi:NAD(P)-binding protein [Novosphingobium decolorationis]|uniref:NAD(P)/FAD-dependent oxidoreductase n=1 Tax=Novosphingobium decolorationis TaxID=2698673 RepID=A0ABX8E6J0_9SPHN|nr:NAD(P)/FAD-dependent oxidoreductase [Novosphingobium decolorationis]QVM83831.1 NAD(P)/FAD-dependent oxidoreductase [Novosphingobium decolorationis]
MAVDMKKSASIAVLGAGAAGLVMGYKLKAAGFENFTIFEKDDAVGGTWKRHNYPGLCCDVHSHIYSYSFDRNPNWSSTFPRRDELLAYFSGFAEKHGLMPYVRLRTAVTKADYNEGEGTWTLSFDG